MRFGERFRSPAVQRLAEKQTRSGVFGVNGYWPEQNEAPIFEVFGGWVDRDDLLWLRDHIDVVLGETPASESLRQPQEGS